MTPATLNGIELPSTDLDESKAFYSVNFGWTFTDYGPTYCAADASGIEVGFSTDATVAPPPVDGAESGVGPLLLLQTDDLEVLHAEMTRSSGTVMVTAPFGFPGGRRFHFSDPSGNIPGAYELDG